MLRAWPSDAPRALPAVQKIELRIVFLAFRADVRAALAHDHPHDGVAAARAGLAGAAEDVQRVGVAPSMPGHAVEVGGAMPQRRALRRYALGQHGADGFVQAPDFGWRQRVGAPRWMVARQPERFIGVDVADAGHAGLVQQQRLDLAALVRELAAQYFRREIVCQRFRSERG